MVSIYENISYLVFIAKGDNMVSHGQRSTLMSRKVTYNDCIEFFAYLLVLVGHQLYLYWANLI